MYRDETDKEYRARQKKEEKECKRGLFEWGFFIGATYWILFSLFALVIYPVFDGNVEAAFTIVSLAFCLSAWVMWLIWACDKYDW